MSARVVSRTDRLPLGTALRLYWIPLAIVAALLAATAILAPDFFQPRNLLNVARQASIVGVISIGMTFVILTGGIDLSVGAILALCGVATAVMVIAGLPLALVIPAAIALGVAVGLLNGMGVALLKIQPFIMTLAMMVLARGAALRVTNGGPKQFLSSNPVLDFLGSGGLGPIPGPVVIFALVAIAGVIVLRYFAFGLHIYAVGGSLEAARLSGVHTSRTRIGAYAISGACAGIAGLMSAARLSVGDPIAGNLVELDSITAVVIGGTSLMGGSGGALGTIGGALLLAVLSNVMNLVGISPFDQLIVKGFVIIGAVLLAARATTPRSGQRLSSGGAKPDAATPVPVQGVRN